MTDVYLGLQDYPESNHDWLYQYPGETETTRFYVVPITCVCNFSFYLMNVVSKVREPSFYRITFENIDDSKRWERKKNI